VAGDGVRSGAGLDLSILVSVSVQAVFLAVRRDWTRPWWRVAAGYVLLALVMDRVLWNPHTGALTRVLLPLTTGFNIQLGHESRSRRFWPWFAAGNLHMVGILRIMPLV
jgi:hypothetical protein